MALASTTGRAHPFYPAAAGYEYIRQMLEYGFDMMQIVYGGLTRKCEVAIMRVAEPGMGVSVRGGVRQYFEKYPDLFNQTGLPELREPGESMSQFLIRFALNHPDMDTMIICTG